MAHSRPKSTARWLAHQALQRIEADGAFTDIVLSHLLEHSELGERDRAFVNELVRGTIRWKKRLDWIVNQLFTGKAEQMPATVRRILWAGLYQLEYMRTPVFAAVNESVNLARKLKLHRWTGVINGVLRNFTRNAALVTFPDRETNQVAWLSVTESHPEWLVKRWIEQFGLETAEALCRANNQAADLSVRVNRLKMAPEEFQALLDAERVEYETSLVDGFWNIRKIDYQFRQRLFNDGLITIQDASAGLPPLLADPRPGQILFDLCAAPGGKSAFAAEMMQNQGVVLSGDKSRARTGLVRQTARRLELGTVFPVVADALHFPARGADIVLLDAPCSGLGVLRKKPDMRWRKKEQDILSLVNLQKTMIRQAAKMVRTGGCLVYSTCTLDPAENEAVIDDFLRDHENFEVDVNHGAVPDQFVTPEGFIRTWPHRHHMDGSFAVKLIKRN